MTIFFINLFRFFREHRTVLYLLLFLSFGLFTFSGLKLAYEEDISKLLPSTDGTKAEGLVFSELKVKDKIFVQLFSRSGSTDADMLLEAGDMFVDSLLAYDQAENDVGDVLHKIDDEVKRQVLSYALENIPLLLDTGIYTKIDTLRGKENIYRQMKTNLEKLSSPEGAVFYRIMRYDPVNLRSILFAGGESGTSGEINDGGEFDLAKMLGENYSLYGNHLFTSDTTAALVFVSPDFMSFDSKAGTRLVNKIERCIRQIEAVYPDVEVLFHGPPVMSVFNSRQIKRDLALTMGVSLLFACMLIVICFRNKSTLPMLLLPVVYGAFFALACMFWLQGIMSLMALGIGAVVLGVALSYCLHVITHYKYLTDPERVLHDQVKPVILGCLTTIGAFMGLMLTQSALLRDFGLFASLAMTGTTAACLLFLPHVFSAVRNRRFERAFDGLEKINSYPLDRQPWLLVLILTAFIAGLLLSPKVEFDANLRNIGYHEPSVTRSMEMYAGKMSGGLATCNYAATSEALDSALICNMELSRICDSLQAAGKIRRYTKSSIILLPEREQEKRISAWKNYWTEERVDELKRNVIAAGEANKFKPAMFEPFFEMLTKDYAPSSVYESSILPEGLMANMIEHSHGIYLVYTSVQLEQENAGVVNGILASQRNVIVADPFYYMTNMVELMHDDFTTILGISSIFVLLVLFVSFRSIPLALIAFLPMGMSWYIVLGVMAMLGLQFNLINIVISTFIFGIGVDYSIFVMEGLLADIKGGDAKLLTYHKTAIFLSAAVLIISISSLMFAEHPALSSIGMATLIGMTSTILITYSVQPFLFRLLMKTGYAGVLRRRNRGKTVDGAGSPPPGKRPAR
ncbi:MAG: MMPL family transporter [Tannerella sp.]|jgi:predicted RND superfamily exporter protein|nr:MMPL family transporter [Tannerella sp.]